MEAPKSYAQQDPPKAMNVITMDCRGLEFIEFKADVRRLHYQPQVSEHPMVPVEMLIKYRGSGKRKAPSQARSLPAST